MKSWLALTTLLLAVAVPASAQSSSGSDDPAPEVAVQIGLLRFNSFASSTLGFDVNYVTQPLTKPSTSLGIKTGIVFEAGFHHFDGTSLSLFQGGVQLTSDKVQTPRFKPYARVMFGIGRFDGSTDKILSLLPGADIIMPGHPFKVRVEIGQVWDLFDGGHEVAWRYSVGLAMALK